MVIFSPQKPHIHPSLHFVAGMVVSPQNRPRYGEAFKIFSLPGIENRPSISSYSFPWDLMNAAGGIFIVYILRVILLEWLNEETEDGPGM